MWEEKLTTEEFIKVNHSLLLLPSYRKHSNKKQFQDLKQVIIKIILFCTATVLGTKVS